MPFSDRGRREPITLPLSGRRETPQGFLSRLGTPLLGKPKGWVLKYQFLNAIE